MLKKITAGLLSIAVLAIPEFANATVVAYEDVPMAKWKLQYYVNGSGTTQIWNTGAPSCPGVSGNPLTLPSTATADEINRFWSLILSAQATGAKVGIMYDNSTCVITSFYTPND